MKTIKPTNKMVLTEDTQFEPGIYLLPDGITLAASGITLNGNGAHLIGDNRQGVGLSLEGVQDVTVKNLQISGYYHGIRAADVQDLVIKHCRITDTAEVPANTRFLDIWRPVTEPYGGAILLTGVSKSRILNNDLQHQMNGLLTYFCEDLQVEGNNASYNSGFGFHLYETSHSSFKDNWADYCCRYNVRPGGEGHLGADSAGFLLVNHSSHNEFLNNAARLSGNGFFLDGMTPDHEPAPCDHNLFEHCDGSYSPNNAFEATFCRGNIFRLNQANQSNYGFWLGFSQENELSDNQIQGNHRAGIAVENGIRSNVTGNTIQDNHFGILLWSRPDPALLQVAPDNDTSKFWRVEGNAIHRNHTGIRIAANQDHGTAPWKPAGGESPETYLRPHNHEILQNDISGNRLGIQTVNTDQTIIKDNSFELNLLGDIKA